MIMKTIRPFAVLVILFFGLLSAVWGVIPFHDDWTYVTAPNVTFEWSQLMPGIEFWRPFDVMWGAVMGKVPNLFPLANRVAICLGHSLNVFLVWQVLFRLGFGNAVGCAWGALYFGLSSSVAAVVVNTDTINQVWCFSFGALALLLSLKRDRFVVWPLIVSFLFKESGVSWLAIIPLVVWLKRSRGLDTEIAIRQFPIRYVGMGVVILAIYFAIRFLLCGKIALGGGGYYELGCTEQETFVNVLIGTIMPLSAVDGLAFACEKWFLFLCTILLSMGLWGSVVLCVTLGAEKKTMYRAAVVAVIAAFAMAIPHCFFKGHHPAEMHFYPVVFAGALLIGSVRVEGKMCRAAVVGILCMLALYGEGWADKFYETYAHSRRTRALFERLRKEKIDFSQPVYFIVELDRDIHYYSTFTSCAAHGLNFGRACRAFNGWRDFDCRVMIGPDESAQIPYHAQVVRIK